VYRVPKAGGEPQLCSALDATLSELDDAAESFCTSTAMSIRSCSR
jgi:hypothetical protein